MDSDFRKLQQPADGQAPATGPQRSSWQNDVISALHGTPVSTSAGNQEATVPPQDNTNTPNTNSYEIPNAQPQPIVSSPSAAEPALQQAPSSYYAQPAAQYRDEPLPPAGDSAEIMPVAVVQVVSTRGVEYAMMTLALWLGALSLLGVLLSLINGGTSSEVLAFPASVLLVCLPVFSFFFLRLKKAELAYPELKVDPSKRRLTQFTQLVAFATCLFTVIAFVYFLISTISGTAGTSILKAVLNVVAILSVAGGILAYYWYDEHISRSGK